MHSKIEIGQYNNVIELSLLKSPFLNDHAFQGMIVLPGSAYLEMAVSIFKKLFNDSPSIIKNVHFENLILLSENKTQINFEMASELKNDLRIKFSEQNNDSLNSEPAITTSLVVSSDIKDKTKKKIDFDIERFQKLAKQKIESKEFYRKLSGNGNQYGPNFQNVEEIWISNDGKSLAKINNPSIKHSIVEELFLDSSLIDSFTQVLSTLSDSDGRTFILNSIEEIRIYEYNLPEEVWCEAKLKTFSNKSDSEFEGDLNVLDSEGNVYFEFKNVKFKYLPNSTEKVDKAKNEKVQLYISSTFTADPLEDSFQFWDNYLSLGLDVKFTPYNQVFQEILNPQSMLSANKNGLNIILIGLEDWARKEHMLPLKVENKRKQELIEGKASYRLPNQLEVVHLNKYETEYVYKEIFIDRCYLKHGISLSDGDTIIDIGANIGLFTLFVNQYCKNPTVYSFEPSPIVYDLLKTNSELYGSNVKPYNYGVSDNTKTASFTFYEASSVFSSFNPDEKDDREAIEVVVRNMLRDTAGTENTALEKYVAEFTSGRLKSKTYECKLLSVSDIIRDNAIVKIDLLKIDAEKSELDIIKGIHDEDWSKIKQIVIEIHDKSKKILEEIEKILHSKGFTITVEEEKMLHESGLFNLFARKNDLDNEEKNLDNGTKVLSEKLDENVGNFTNALSSFNQHSSAPLILAIAPRSPDIESDQTIKNIYDSYETSLITKIKHLQNVYIISSEKLVKAFAVKDYYDEQGNELGHIPYSLPFFSSLGTSLVRQIYSLIHPPYKVIALDCDNTLWKGVCGEDGPGGIQITENYKFFQKFILDQIQSGMLVCLCSKNNEEDVLQVFEKRNDMILKQEQLVSWKTNWDFKSSNLKSLAAELNLGLDSFIFIDDNPVECAEVKANCPEVLTLQLPQNEDEIPPFLKNIWAFDHTKITEEDKKRTKMYQENIKREKYLSDSLTLKDFLDGLNLKISISSPMPEDIERISQLTYRTNQFNFTTIRRSEAEIKKLIDFENYKCLIANVSDRFGDYGLVGLLFYKEKDTEIIVDTFLLSCRVLGRGVEHKFLSELGKIAINNNIKSVTVNYLQTKKNRPAWEFIEKLGNEFKSEITGGYKYTFPSEVLATLTYDPASYSLEATEKKESKKDKNLEAKIISNRNGQIQKIGLELNNASLIFQKVEEFKLAQSNSSLNNYIAPDSEMEKKLTEIWEKVLGVSRVGINDNFFEIGGTSLKAVQLIATIKKELGKGISVVTIFECPTVKLLSEKIGNNEDLKSESRFDTQVDRGLRRRTKNISRKHTNE